MKRNINEKWLVGFYKPFSMRSEAPNKLDG
nr:MAG TPA: hypothetical protein [Caudoviricetes sp.]